MTDPVRRFWQGVREVLQERVRIRAALRHLGDDLVYMRLTSRAYRDVLERGGGFVEAPKQAGSLGRYSLWQLMSHLRGMRDRQRSQELRRLDREGWLAVGVWLEEPPQRYFYHRLERIRLDRDLWDELPHAAKERLESVREGLEMSAAWSWTVCDIPGCGRFTLRLRNTGACRVCRRRLPAKRRMAARRRPPDRLEADDRRAKRRRGDLTRFLARYGIPLVAPGGRPTGRPRLADGITEERFRELLTEGRLRALFTALERLTPAAIRRLRRQ